MVVGDNMVVEGREEGGGRGAGQQRVWRGGSKGRSREGSEGWGWLKG